MGPDHASFPDDEETLLLRSHSCETAHLRQVVHGTQQDLLCSCFGKVIAHRFESNSAEKENVMNNLWKWAGISVAMALMFAVMSGVLVAQDAKIFEGSLMGVDPNTRVLTLKDGETQMQFTYTDQTELVGPQKDGQPIAVRQGSKLKIYYKESDKANVAMKIEVTEL